MFRERSVSWISLGVGWSSYNAIGAKYESSGEGFINLNCVIFPWLLNFSSQHPPVSFSLLNLESNLPYRIILFAVNRKGRSEPTIVDVTLRGSAEFNGSLYQNYIFGFEIHIVLNFPPTGFTSDYLQFEISPLLAGLSVAATSLFVFICCVLVVLCRRQRNEDK